MGVFYRKPSTAELSWLKGLLIFVVVLDHNDYWRYLFSDEMRPLTVHVIGFFLVSFYGAYSNKEDIKQYVSTRFVRYGWPFVVFMGIYALGTYVVSGQHVFPFGQFLQAILTGSFVNTKAGGGGAFMWFLPALIGFTIVTKLLGRLSAVSLTIYTSFCFVCMLSFPLLDMRLRANVPVGILVVFYVHSFVIPSLLLDRYLQTLAPRLKMAVVLSLAVMSFIAYCILVGDKKYIEVGLMVGPTFFDMPYAVLNYVHVVSALLVFLHVSGGLWFSRIFVRMGENSLYIYLLHPLLFYLIYKVLSGMLSSSVEYVFLKAVASIFLAIFPAILIGRFIESSPDFRMALFPKNIKEVNFSIRRLKRRIRGG